MAEWVEFNMLKTLPETVRAKLQEGEKVAQHIIDGLRLYYGEECKEIPLLFKNPTKRWRLENDTDYLDDGNTPTPGMEVTGVYFWLLTPGYIPSPFDVYQGRSSNAVSFCQKVEWRVKDGRIGKSSSFETCVGLSRVENNRWQKRIDLSWGLPTITESLMLELVYHLDEFRKVEAIRQRLREVL